MQGQCLPVLPELTGKTEIHDTTIDNVFTRWADDGSLEYAFVASVRHLSAQKHLDLRVLHGDGTSTVAKKGGDGMGYSGHKHQKGKKIIAMLLLEGVKGLKRRATLTGLELQGSYRTLDGGFDSARNRKAIFHAGLLPNLTENRPNHPHRKRGRRRLGNAAMHAWRDRGEWTCAWEDKFKRLLLRFEPCQRRHYGMTLMALHHEQCEAVL